MTVEERLARLEASAAERIRFDDKFRQDIDTDMREMKEDLRTIRDTLAQARGGWKTLMLVAGMAGAAGAILGKLSALIGLAK